LWTLFAYLIVYAFLAGTTRMRLKNQKTPTSIPLSHNNKESSENELNHTSEGFDIPMVRAHWHHAVFTILLIVAVLVVSIDVEDKTAFRMFQYPPMVSPALA
jgi:hypothetical protein